MYIGIEIGGTKLQLGLGAGDGRLLSLWRGNVDVAAGGDGIRQQIVSAIPELLAIGQVDRGAIQGVGIGFGGPIDDTTRSVIKSHQVGGWDGFLLVDWIGNALGLLAVLGNDADVAGLAEAHFGAGQGASPVFYMTIGSGIGGGLIVDGTIQRGTGRGAAEIGHLRVRDPHRSDGAMDTLENLASGWALGRHAREAVLDDPAGGVPLLGLAGGVAEITAETVATAATFGDPIADGVLSLGIDALADVPALVLAFAMRKS